MKPAPSISQILSLNLCKLRYREGMKITQENFAKKAGLSLPCYQLIKSGKAWPERKTVQIIAKGFEVEEWELFQYRDFFKDPDMGQIRRVIEEALEGYELKKEEEKNI